MSIEHSITINCQAQDIFDIYKDVHSWKKWDPDVEAAHMDGDFSVNSTGWIKPKGGPKTNTRITQVKEPHSFTVISKLPLCTMVFVHDLKETAGKTEVTHAVHFNGFLAPLFSRLIGAKIKNGIDDTMQGLKNFAERG